MQITLLAQRQFPLDDVAAQLRQEGVSVTACPWQTNVREITLPAEVGCAGLIVPGAAVVVLGERVKEARKVLGAAATLILCGPELPNADRALVLKHGVSLSTPRSWAPEHVAERLLAELALHAAEPLGLGSLRGATGRMRALYAEIEQIAPLHEPVLVLGETGTGKELVARELHRLGKKQGELLSLNCAEFTPELLAAELFGHEQGAFTGAARKRAGLMAEAGAGTLFLDEIGELDAQSQAKLLRVLQERKFRAVGSDKFQTLHARLVFATNRNLEEASAEGKFRRDLLERINGFTLQLPPLRARRADIPLLVRYFVAEYEREYPERRLQIPPGALDCLFRAEWPGNVRQLRKEVRRAAAYADADGNLNVVRLQEAAGRGEKGAVRHAITFDPATDGWRALQQRVTAVYIRALLAHTNNNKAAAIRLSGLSKSHFYELLEKTESESPTG
jgi:DNA-binding NtrC family response regulator